MNRRVPAVIGLILTGFLLAACGASAPVDEADQVATRVAEDLAVAATLTAAVPSAAAQATPEPAVPTEVASVPTASALPPTAPAEEAATEAPPPTNTPPPASTDTPPPPSPTPLLIAVLPVDGGGGDVPNIRNNNPVKGGRNVTLPGHLPSEATEPMVYRDRIVFQAEVFDATIGARDGDGIENVTFTILGPTGDLVHERTEDNAGYCVFGGGEQECDELSLTQDSPLWPGGAPISSGQYNVSIDINPYNGDNVIWMWSFEIALPQTTSAGISGISLKGDSYAVDFDTYGFEPHLPGQHVHFFLNTVSPEDAGMPGQGPWVVYGGKSPFTEYGILDRPASASQLCVLVANPDHSVQAESGNCWDLP